MKLSDFKGVFKKSTLVIESIENPFADYYSIKLKQLDEAVWTPGEHAIFRMDVGNINGKKTRAFSIASISDEGHILIGTKTGKTISDFKQALINSKQGDKVFMRGPFGWFKLKDDVSPVIMIAGGVGITPIRALLMSQRHNTNRPTEIIYSSRDYYLYENDIDEIVKNNSRINCIKVQTSSDAVAAVTKMANIHKNEALYYISGSQGFIKAMKKNIVSQGVKGKRIVNDPFYGY